MAFKESSAPVLSNMPIPGHGLPGLLFLLSAVVLGLSLFLGWYSIVGGFQSEQFSETLSPTTVHTVGSGSVDYTSSYPNARLPATGGLYEAVTGFIVVSLVIGILLGLVGLLGKWQRRRKVLLLLAAMAALLAFAGPIALAWDQSSTISSDEAGFSPPFHTGPIVLHPDGGVRTWEFYLGQGGWYNGGWSTAGPGSSFVGHTTTPNGGGSLAWEPDRGFYVALAGAGIMTIAASYAFLERRLAEGVAKAATSAQADDRFGHADP